VAWDPIKAPDEVKTGCLGKEGNEEWRPRTPVPFGLLPKEPGGSLQSAAGQSARLRFAPCPGALSALQRNCGHRVNRRWSFTHSSGRDAKRISANGGALPLLCGNIEHDPFRAHGKIEPGPFDRL